MKKNKYELIDQDSYYRAFQRWLDSSSDTYNLKDEDQMNERWLKFADDLGIFLGGEEVNGRMPVEIVDNICWKEARKYYSIVSYETNFEVNEESVR